MADFGDRNQEVTSHETLYYLKFEFPCKFFLMCCITYLSSQCFYYVFQADKVVQLYETMLTRHTSMVVGPTGGGKSVVINALAQAQTK